MLELLVTQQALCAERGERIDPALHDHVELLLENYLRQLSRTLNSVVDLQQRIQAQQDLATSFLDVYRNKMLRVEVQLAIASVAIGASTAVSGLFGMNLHSGLEEVQGIFLPVVVGALMCGGGIYVYAWHWYSDFLLKKEQRYAAQEQKSLMTMFTDLKVFDLAVRQAHNEGRALRMDEFKKLVSECSVEGNKIQDKEIQMMFNMLDESQDGVLHRHEVFALQAVRRQKDPS
mmetsp:Transcript_18043/g.27976  ORF Transcript_18043/g.27976 Transcript_18043/m.27976 type:complete len:232 (-) Transcript_18043:880-1575(-)